MITIGSLFSGVGGLEYGLEAAFAASGIGCRVLWQVELDAFCRGVLANHWPIADRSVCDVESEALFGLPRVDVICGGPPCPDFSGAGRGAGIEGERGRLIFAYERAVRTLRPRAVVLENVASGKVRWLPHVRRFLEHAGYRTRALGVAASDVGSPQRRKRIFVLGMANADRLRELRQEGADGEGRGRVGDGSADVSDDHGATIRLGREREAGGLKDRIREQGRSESGHAGAEGMGRGAQSGLGRDDSGVPRLVDRWPSGRGQAQKAWEPPRAYQAQRGDWRAQRLKALGNSVVPHCGYVAGRALLEWFDELK